MYESLIRPILFALSNKDAERAHILAVKFIKVVQATPGLPEIIAWYYQAKTPQPVTVAGIHFPNPIGVAAGFDKNCELLPFCQAIGFGFAEIGTVLPRPQSGNPRPRLFRIPEHNGLINRMGFNSPGAIIAAKNLQRHAKRVSIPFGISVSRNKDSENTPEAMVADCIATLRQIGPYGDYIAIGLSSPNTPGLRDLQTAKSAGAIIRGVVAEELRLAEQWRRQPRPIFVKLAPDMLTVDMIETMNTCLEAGAVGLIIANTTISRPNFMNAHKPNHLHETGGLSGLSLYDRAIEALAALRQENSAVPLIGVGGVHNYSRAQGMFKAGANLVQLYTSLVYHGPKVVSDVRGLNRKLVPVLG